VTQAKGEFQLLFYGHGILLQSFSVRRKGRLARVNTLRYVYGMAREKTNLNGKGTLSV
jgi:hypothetical protein